jgi:hypothetical protein
MTRISSALLVLKSNQKEHPMEKAKTHFEQIPVEIVKKIAHEVESEKKIKSDNVTVEIPSAKTEPYSASAGVQCRNRAW